MRFVDQNQTDFASEIRVEPDHLLGEIQFVDDSLTGAVAARKEFEVAQFVEGAISVDVMHRFLGIKFSSQVLFHHVAVFEDVARRFSVFAGHDEPDVTVSNNSFGKLLIRIVRLVGYSSKQRATFGAAQTLTPVDCAARTPLNFHPVAALDASSVPGFFRKSAPDAAAIRGAVHRLLAEFFYVGAGVTRFVAEWFTANFARKIYARYSSVFSTKFGLVRDFARSTTELLGRVPRSDFEVLPATIANFLNRHLCISYLVGADRSSTACRLSKQEI